MTKYILSVLLFFVSFTLFAQTSVNQVLCGESENPLNVDRQNPSLSWILKSDLRSVKQVAYRILVADDTLLLKKNIGNIWDSKKVSSNQSIAIPFSGKKLESSKIYYWKVRIWDNYKSVSGWSESAKWQMGLLTPDAWMGAKWIAYEKLPDSLRIVPALDNPADKRWTEGKDVLPLLRKTFIVSKKVKNATAYICGLGQFELSLNGNKVGDHFLDPGWTQYDKHALYVTFDITQSLKKGENSIGVMLGNGFYFVPGDRYHKLRGAFGYPKMICRFNIQYDDGTSENIISNETWKTSPGPVIFSSIYGGEDYDATLEQKGWNKAGFDDSKWKNAIVVDGPQQLDAQTEEPLKIFDQFLPKKMTHPKPGVWVYDMGQNASAIPLITVSGNKGSVIKITPAELLDENGLADQSAVGAPVYFNYKLKGDGAESWHPQFIYYGFRYIQIEGGRPDSAVDKGNLPVVISIKSLHTRSASKNIGKFECSDSLFNNIFKLIDWAIKSNTVSIFTDCPHREKLGWLEEAHLVGNSIHYNYDIGTLCRKVIKDMMYAQTADGLIPDIAPEYVKFADGFRDSPEWGSSGIILPYYVYQWYGDKKILKESYSMMSRYADYLGKHSKDHILYFGLGDWYDIGPGPLGESQLTPRGITGTAIYYYDLNILAKVAAILGKTVDEKAYIRLAAKVRKAYNEKFYHSETGQYGTGSQTANAISCYMGLVESTNKQKVLNNLVKDIRNHNYAVTAGDIGYRYLLKVLDDNGYSSVIYDMNSRVDVPGYGYQLAKGATALTESWQGTRNASNNHFMLGHLIEWFYSGLAGIKMEQNATAFETIIIKPEQAGNITHVKASYLSPHGAISNEWIKTGKTFKMNTNIPANTSALIYLPATRVSSITEGGKSVFNRKDLKVVRLKQGKVLIKAGSGYYSFIVN